MGDLNSKSTLWCSPNTDQRGLIIEKLIDDNNFVLNNGHYNVSQTHLDLSLICHTRSTKSCWEVLNDTFGIDHSSTITHINAVPAEDIDDCDEFILSIANWQSFKINARNLQTADLISETVSADNFFLNR